MTQSPMTLVSVLTVRRDAIAAFRAFERHAAAVMADHGGRIERAVVVDPDPASPTLREVHVVTFPDAAALAAYRADPRLAARAHLRDAAVTATEVLAGVDGPDYHAAERPSGG